MAPAKNPEVARHHAVGRGSKTLTARIDHFDLERLRDEENVPMVYVSHDPDELRQLASQIVMLKHGRIVAFGGTDVLPA